MKLEDLKTYELVEQRTLGDLNSEGLVFCHKKSGARVAVISNDDDNKVFYIGFRTPAEDSTGAPHIIEHSVLCGSDKYPVKDPFVELVKGSLNTFLNGSISKSKDNLIFSVTGFGFSNFSSSVGFLICITMIRFGMND